MPNRDGMVIPDWIIDEIHWEDIDIPSYYPEHIFKYDTKATFDGLFRWNDDDEGFPLTKCMNCTYCIKPDDGEYICKYSHHGGKPERETCNYERKKR